MKKILLTFFSSLLLTNYLAAQNEDYDTGVVSLAGREGFAIESKDKSFVFKPYLLVQTAAKFNYYDDEGLDKAYNQDNVANSGFAVPYAVLGFTGKAFSMVSYNLSVNAAAQGGALLQQAWFDIAIKKSLAFRVGKFKTPFSHAYLTTLGESLFPNVPTSLSSSVILPYSLNAVTPNIATGFDLGAEVHGNFGKFGYEAGLFNGTGAGTNAATKTFSDDWHIPSLLYAGRLSFMPLGAMPSTQGSPKVMETNRLMFAISTSLNVESESESTNDFRAGFEFAWLCNRLYLGGEFYYLHIGFTERQKIDDKYNYIAGYFQGGYFCTDKLQAAVRYDIYDRNATDKNGYLNMPAVGFNYFFTECNLKLSAMYQYIGRMNHDTQLDRDVDDLGLAKHSATILLQYSF